MEKLTLELTDKLDNLDMEERLDNFSMETLEAIAALAIGRKDEKLFSWLKEVKILFSDYYVGERDEWNIENRTLSIMITRSNKLRNIKYVIQKRIDDMHEEVESYKHIENIIPYALESMFHGERPSRYMEIRKHFQKDNFAFVTYKVVVEKMRGRKGNRRRYTEAVEREVVIERWGDAGENYKTKKTKGKEMFKDLMAQMEAPKAKYIDVQIQARLLDQYQNATRHVGIAVDAETKESMLTIYGEYKFDTAFVLKELTRPYVEYHSGDAVWISFRKDTYHNGEFVQSKIEEEKFFHINEYGGLVETSTNPFRFKLVTREEPPAISTSPKTDKDLFIDVTHDETDIVIPFNHEYIEVEILKETFEAREYLIKNKINSKYKLLYFANYEGRWIHTTNRNHKVKLMLDSYNMVEILTVDEQ